MRLRPFGDSSRVTDKTSITALNLRISGICGSIADWTAVEHGFGFDCFASTGLKCAWDNVSNSTIAAIGSRGSRLVPLPIHGRPFSFIVALPPLGMVLFQT